MANRFWVGGTAIWDATAGTKWATTSGGAGGAAVPLASDDVFFDASSGVVTISIPTGNIAVCRSLTCTGFTGTLSMTSPSGFTLVIGDASGGALTLSAGMTVTLGGSAIVVMNTSGTNGGTGYPVTTAGKSLPEVRWNGSGTWSLQDTFNSVSGGFSHSAGTIITNNNTINCLTFNSATGSTRTLTLGSSAINCSATGTPFNLSVTTGLTMTTNTATITCSGANAICIVQSGFNYNGSSVVMSGSGTAQFANSATVANLTRTGTAVKTDVLQLNGGSLTVTGTFTVNGNSSTNRVLVQSITPGSVRTVSAGAVSMSNVDISDVSASGAANWNLSAISGGAGDCQGNTGITFTTPVTRYRVAAGNWSSTAVWSASSGGASGASVPLPQDNVILNSASVVGTLTSDMPRLCRNFTCTGYTGGWNASANGNIFGDVTLASGMGGAGQVFGFTLGLYGRGAQTFTSATRSLSAMTMEAVTGSYTLQDDLLMATGATPNLNISSGTFNTNDETVTCGFLVAQSGRATTVNLGASTINLTNTSAVVWSTNNAATTLNSGTATVVIATASNSIRTVVADSSSRTIPTLTYTVANSAGPLALGNTVNNGTMTIGTLNVGPGRRLTMFAGSTVTVGTWNVSGAANGYVRLPGVSGSYISTPDSVPVSVTGDIDVRIRVALDDWTPAASMVLLCHEGSTTQRSYDLMVLTSGSIVFRLSTDGSTFVDTGVNLGAIAADGATIWIRATWRASDGRAQIFTASGSLTNPVAADFAQIGTNSTGAIPSIFNATTPVEIGSRFLGTTDVALGNFYRAQIRNGIDGTLVFDADLTRDLSSTWIDAAATQFAESSSNGATVTINGLAVTGDGRIAIDSSTASSASTLANGGTTTIRSRYVTVKDSTAPAVSPRAYALPPSVLVSGATNWILVGGEPTDTDTGSGDDQVVNVRLTDNDAGSGGDSQTFSPVSGLPKLKINGEWVEAPYRMKINGVFVFIDVRVKVNGGFVAV